MRITGGTLRGRVLDAPEGLSTRPTTDRVREALFNILAHHDWGFDPLDGAAALDAFAGTGALGIEALSRGAARACFFEKDRKAFRTLKTNVERLNLSGSASLLETDVRAPPRAHAPCSLVFLDPPYRKGLIESALTSLAAQGWFAPQTLFVAETAKNETLNLPDSYACGLERVYGDTCIRFYRNSLPVK